MGGVFGGGNSYAGGGQAAYNQQQPSFPGYDYPNDYQIPGVASGDYGGGGDYGAYTSYGGGAGSPTDPGAGYYDVGGGGTALGGGGGILDWLGSEKGQRALQQLGGFSAGMLQGSAPSLQPRNFATGLGAGMAGFQQAGSQYYQDALHRAQSEKAAADIENLRLSSGLLANEARNATGLPPGYGMPPVGGAPPTGAPAAAGGEGGGSGGRGGWGPLAQPAIGALTTAGLSTAAQQAIMGHGLAEGGFNDPWRAGDSGNSFGHWQFNKGGELPGYLAWAQGKGNPQDTALQAQYVAKRMEEIHPGFSKVTDPAQAMAMVADFERYKGYQTNKRLGYLADAQKAMGGGELAPRMPIPGSFADTAFQMPRNMAAGLNAPLPGAPAPGILPPPPPTPAVTQPRGLLASGEDRAAPITLMAGGGARPVAPAATQPEPTAAAAASGGAPNNPSEYTAVGDSIAGHLIRKAKVGGKEHVFDRKEDSTAVAGYDPSQVLDLINSAPRESIEGKNVILSSGASNDPKQLDRVTDQIRALRERNVAGITLIGVGTAKKLAGVNDRLAQIAADNGVAFAGPLARVAGDGIHSRDPSAVFQQAATATQPTGERQYPRPDDPTMGGGGAEGREGLTAGSLIPNIRTPAEVAAGPLPAAPAPAPAPAPGAVGASPPPPAPAAATAPPVPAGPSPAAATGPGAMPAPPPVERAPTLPAPNLGQIQPPGMGGIPPYNVEAARRAQVLSIAGTMAGRQMPAYITEQANLPNKAVEQQWAQQKELYTQQLQGARDQWKAMNDAQQAEVAARNGMTKAQFESELRQREKNLELGRMWDPQTNQYVKIPGAAEVAGAQAGAIKGAQEAATPTTEMKDYDAYAADQKARGLPVMSVFDYGQARRNAAATNITQKVEGKGQEVMIQAGVDAMKTAQDHALSAMKSTQTLGQLANAMQGFTPGAFADKRSAFWGAMADLGIGTGKETTAAQVFQSGATRLQVLMAPKGQGSMSDFERSLFQQINPQMVNTPEALQQMINIALRLDNYDRQVAEIHRQAARDNKVNPGLPDYLEAMDRIQRLGPPLSPQEMAALDRVRKPAEGAGAGPARTVPPGSGNPYGGVR